MRDLTLSPDLRLDLDAVTKTFGILAQRRKGKTYTASVLAEEFVAAGVPWVAIDPTGAWWGLRSGADGKAKGGLPVIVMGGQHGDVPLERGSGKLVADLVLDNPGWYVLDLSLLETKGAEREFSTAFAERLYRRKGQPGLDFPMHLFIDEADVFIAQRTEKGDQRMLSAFSTIVRRGGLRGLGTTLISQRAAVVHKDVLEQLDALIVLRTVGPNDQAAVKRYVAAQGTPEQMAEMMGSLASLDQGEAWYWEPGEQIFQRLRVRARRTFNSSATPKPGERVVVPTARVDIDLDAVREAMEATIERAKADDPAALKARIRALEAQVAEAPAGAPAPEPVRVEVPVFSPEAEAILDDVTVAANDLFRRAGELRDETEALLLAVQQVEVARVAAMEQEEARPKQDPRPAPLRGEQARAPRPRPALPPDSAVPEVPGGAPGQIVNLLAHFPEGLPQQKIGTRSGIGNKKSTLRNALTALRKLGLIEGTADLIVPTALGLAAAGEVEPLPTGRDLLDHWQREVGNPESAPRRIFDALVACYPEKLSMGMIAVHTGIDVEKSTIRNALTRLNELGLIDRWHGSVGASGELMNEIVAGS